VVRYTARDTLSLSQARTLGRVGSILVFIPFVSIVGYILILIAINDLSKSLQDRSIFKNTLIAVALEIVGWIVGLAVLLGGALTSPLTGGTSALVGLFGGLAIIWIFFIAAAFFLKRSYDTIAYLSEKYSRRSRSSRSPTNQGRSVRLHRTCRPLPGRYLRPPTSR
jgi:uncharacterized membrane protein